ncbi:hypothetical protein [Sporosarcina sp. HYO08]|uniref:hypothetical protein n=1 Tax=Sporosarcina sp. HYO08 TaxID=1759557 RepID=UPI0007995213|nr:hypothetical protein [Sporosarcina sp. HYO08]KXH78826.1 hypothetical protein AU377_12560 [Sporosarcina sp. HYO08]
MGNNKFGKFIVLGSVIGAVVSLFDSHTRYQVTRKSKEMIWDIRYYSKNPEILMNKIQVKKEKYKIVYEQIAEDLTYIKEQVNHMKALTPQVKSLVMDTKDAFIESKDEYKAIIEEKA